MPKRRFGKLEPCFTESSFDATTELAGERKYNREPQKHDNYHPENSGPIAPCTDHMGQQANQEHCENTDGYLSNRKYSVRVAR